MDKRGAKDKSRKRTRNKWFEIQDSTYYYQELSKPKIIWGEISDRSKFAMDFNGEYLCEATTFFMTGEISISLLCYLNSKIAEFLFSKVATTTGMGTVRWKKYKIEKLLVPEKSERIQLDIEKLYSKYSISNDITFISEIDRIFYDLYGLTEEEIAIVEGRQ